MNNYNKMDKGSIEAMTALKNENKKELGTYKNSTKIQMKKCRENIKNNMKGKMLEMLEYLGVYALNFLGRLIGAKSLFI